MEGGMMRGLRATSILLGVIIDKLAAVVSIGLLLSILGAATSSFQVAALVAGALCTILGAFVAARQAKQRPLAHGVAVGVVGLVISVSRFVLTPVLSAPDSTAAHSVPWELTAWFTVVVAGFAGGALASGSRDYRSADKGSQLTANGRHGES